MDTPAGKLFDVVLLIAIVVSVIVVMLESVPSLSTRFTREFEIGEWGFTILFTIEYVLRLISARKPLNYVFSFYGVIDLVCILPTYLGLFMTGAESLMAIRTIRLLRVFRVLKLVRYIKEAQFLISALKESRPKIIVFLVAVLGIATIMGTIMYIIEDPDAGFTSIPRSIYWAIVTMTTVGYGDISPVTPVGQAFAAILMLMGYAIIAVPTGIVTAQAMAQGSKGEDKVCDDCGFVATAPEAEYCERCGTKLP